MNCTNVLDNAADTVSNQGFKQDAEEIRQARDIIAALADAARVVTTKTSAGHFSPDARDLQTLADALADFDKETAP